MNEDIADDYKCYAQANSAKYVDKDKGPIAGLEAESLPYTVTIQGTVDRGWTFPLIQLTP